MQKPSDMAKQNNDSASSETPPAQMMIDGETLPVRMENAEPEFDSIDAVFRLLIGGTADLSDIFLQQLEQWETNIVSRQNATIVEEEEDLGDILRYLLVGLMFESQQQVRNSASNVGSWLLGAANITASVTRPITQSRLFSPVRKSAGAVTGRLESRIAELVQVGRSEEFAGRLVAEEALQETMEWAMDYIAQNPEIRDLVTQQAMGFTEEITVGVRERTITTDNLIDGFLRRLFRRTPRTDLPPPPEVVQNRALSTPQSEQDDSG